MVSFLCKCNDTTAGISVVALLSAISIQHHSRHKYHNLVFGISIVTSVSIMVSFLALVSLHHCQCLSDGITAVISVMTSLSAWALQYTLLSILYYTVIFVAGTIMPHVNTSTIMLMLLLELNGWNCCQAHNVYNVGMP